MLVLALEMHDARPRFGHVSYFCEAESRCSRSFLQPFFPYSHIPLHTLLHVSCSEPKERGAKRFKMPLAPCGRGVGAFKGRFFSRRGFGKGIRRKIGERKLTTLKGTDESVKPTEGRQTESGRDVGIGQFVGLS